MTKRKIIVIEDERDMADLIAMRLQREHYDVDVAYTGTSGIERVRSGGADLLLLDIMLPGMSGTDVLKALRQDPKYASLPVILLTAKGEEGDIIAGLHLGADDYVTKPFSMSVLTARVAAVLRRSETGSMEEKQILSAGPITVNRDTHRVDVDGRQVSLTLTEFKILSAIIAARGRVLTRNQLIDHAMGIDAIVTDRTIDVHLAALRRKLGKARKYIQTVRGVGYRLATEDDETT
jgi:two-component system phosphate regulon response regulator PhoB